MAAAASALSLATRNPQLLNTGEALGISMPALNTSILTASDFTITDLGLGSAARLGPVLPVNLGDLGPSNAISVNGRFATAGLVVGSRYLITARGTYRVGNGIYGWTVNRLIVVPGPVVSPVPLFAARLTAQVTPGLWSYTLHNDEPPGNLRSINAVSIDMGAPFTVKSTPAGWAADTDNFSYILWYATDVAAPYPNHIAPGASLSGFSIESARTTSQGRGFIITSWDRVNDRADLTALGSIETPSQL